MHLDLDAFCEVVKKLDKTNAEKALAILWYQDRKQAEIVMSAGQLTRVLGDHHLGTANSTNLGKAITKTKLANEKATGFCLKPGSRSIIRGWLPDDLDGIQPIMDHSTGYVPEPVWRNTRGYIEAVCRELNGSFRAAYYNAAAVMLRRLLETLIIEAYEHLKRHDEIKDRTGNYFMLKELVDHAIGNNGPGLNLGRDSKTCLKDAREVGNWAAHARRYIAHAPDLTKLQSGVRILTQELIQIANLKSTPPRSS